MVLLPNKVLWSHLALPETSRWFHLGGGFHYVGPQNFWIFAPPPSVRTYLMEAPLCDLNWHKIGSKIFVLKNFSLENKIMLLKMAVILGSWASDLAESVLFNITLDAIWTKFTGKSSHLITWFLYCRTRTEPGGAIRGKLDEVTGGIYSPEELVRR